MDAKICKKEGGKWDVREKRCVLRFAEQPIIATTKRGGEYRTPGYWVEFTRADKGYLVAWGDERGSLGSKEFDKGQHGYAESHYESKLDAYDILED